MSNALLDSTARLARAVFGARAASILLYDEPAGELWFAAVSGEGADTVPGLRIPAASGIAGWVLSARQPIVLEDVASDPRYAEEVASISGYQPQGLMAAPLLADDRPLGVLEVLDRPQRSHFSLIELDLLGLLADQAATALGQERVSDRDRGAAPASIGRLWSALDRLDPKQHERAETLLDALAQLLGGPD
jgi:GAF domain-containing protein